MASQRDWLDAGLEIVAEDGARALTIERLMGRLGLSKGSFYHHFKGMGDYVQALTGLHESLHTTRFIDMVEQDTAASARAKLQHLIELATTEDEDPALEVGMRAWAQQNPVVGSMQRRVDATRTDYLRTLFTAISGDPAKASELAELLYLIVVGAQHVLPPIPPDRRRHHYDLALQLLSDRTP